MKNFIGALFCLTVIISCSDNQFGNESEGLFKISCDLEIPFLEDSTKVVAEGSTEVLINAKGRTREMSRSGEFGAKTGKDVKFVCSFELEGLNVDDLYHISIWKSPGSQSGKLVINADEFNKMGGVVTEVDSRGWQKIELEYHIPPIYKGGKGAFYFWNPSDETIFVDDLVVEKREINIAQFPEEPLKLMINDANYEKLQKLRTRAFEEEMIITDDDSFAKAILVYDEDYKKAKIRFKGDWLDHIQGYKWSFRIALKGGASWRGMRTFNIQSPSTRNHLSEWLAHKIAEKENILTTRYDFVPVEINSKNVGLYVYEEHFEKQLIESKNRREGPILKFTEDQFWDAIRYKTHNSYSPFASAKIVPYKLNRTLKDDKLRSHFLAGKNLLNAYKNKSAPVDQIFDLDKMAKYLAYIDFVKGYHGSRWHNVRFYYNPVLSRLEPIAYDMNEEHGPLEAIPNALLANVNLGEISAGYNAIACSGSLFSDSLFYEKYLENVEYFANEEYVNELYAQFGDEIDLREEQLRFEFPKYSFNRQLLFENQNAMRKELSEMRKFTFQQFSERHEKNKIREEQLKFSNYPEEIIKKIVHIHEEAKGFKIINHSLSELELLSQLSDKEEHKYDKKLIVPAYNKMPGELFVESKGEKIKHFVLNVMKQDSICKIKILDWPSPKSSLNVIRKFEMPEWIIDEGSNWRVRQGEYHLSRPIAFPGNKKCIVEAGVQIDFTNDAYLWSYSAIDFMGTEKKPIEFKSSDESARGVTIVQADEISSVNYTSFVGFNTFHEGDWEHTGAVTWYESDVIIRNCNFQKNLCEDALNIVRSNFDISDCLFEDVYGDAFDADFCTGIIASSEFNRIGNDAIDFSGSKVEILSVKISGAEDKAISGGEASNLVVQDCEIDHVNIAIASKDKSSLKLSDIKISNADYGLVAYVKKPEYGPAEINASECQFTDVDQNQLIERESVLHLNDKEILGDKRNLKKLFY